jgi:hypothetical protein
VCGNLASSVSGQLACMLDPASLSGGGENLECVGGDFARDAWGCE